MKAQDFVYDSEVYSIVENLQADGIDKRQFSDVVDASGRQYVDLVQEGGGVLGIALLGYTYVLEKMGIRFFSLAGTSAGAINTLLLAAHGGIHDEKSEWMLEKLANKDLYEFVDGPERVRNFLDAILEGDGNLKLAWHWFRSHDYIQEHLGFNPGTNFHTWLKEILAEEGIQTTADLMAKRAKRPAGFALRENRSDGVAMNPRLVFVATDVSTETRVQFPEMNVLYWTDEEKVNPADYVRASMSIPGFFHPFRIRIGDAERREKKEAWHEMARYTGKLPDEAVLVDGGIVSNFPIDVFHDNTIVPSRPTFGVKLGDDRNEPKEIENLKAYAGAVFNSARHVLDFEFILRNPDYRRLITHVRVEGFDWLNFSMSDERKIQLFERGAEAANQFLRRFDWDGYKRLRSEKVEYERVAREDIPVPSGPNNS